MSKQLTGATLPVLRLEVGTEGQQRPDGVRVSFLQGGAQGVIGLALPALAQRIHALPG